MLRLSVGCLSYVVAICSVVISTYNTPVQGNAEAKHNDLERRVARLEHTVQRILEYMDKDQRSRAADWFVISKETRTENVENEDKTGEYLPNSQVMPHNKVEGFIRTETADPEFDLNKPQNDLESEKKELKKKSAQSKKSSGTTGRGEKKEMAFFLWALTSSLQDTRNRLNELTLQTETIMNNTALLDTANNRNLKSIAVVIDLLNSTANIDCKKVKEEMGEMAGIKFHETIIFEVLITALSKESAKRMLEIKEKNIPLWRKAVFVCDLPLSQRNWTMLHVAATLDDVQLARVLLWRGADIYARNSYQFTALHQAALFNSASVVKLLLDHGADIEQTATTSNTALHLAAKGRAVEAARILIQHGADVDAVNWDKQSSLQLAAESKSIPLIKLLLDANANIDYQDENSYSALHYAAMEGCSECLKILVQRGANIDNQDNDGRSALHVAVRRGCSECVKILVQMGANGSLRDKYGVPAYH